jgi:exopolysaccharide biosynthesis polyprenyl glycosylphosphotransferase
MTEEYPALGYEVVGFVSTNDRLKRNDAKTNLKHRPLLGSIGELPSIIERHHVQQVLIGLDSAQHDQLLDVISFCNGHDVRMKILPDLYNIVSGQARINSIFGQELMEVHPQIMKPWEEVAKRTVDLVVSAIVLLVTLPFLFLIGLAVLVDSRRPILYRQDRVGKNGRQFNMLKFRSMLQDAEEQSGPTWAEKDDPRATKVGRFLRRTHLDEVPQFYNVLVGDMSLVGPRPERKYFSDQFAKEIPLYRHRLRVRPGITGWAQIKYQYDQSIDDVKSKLRQDLFYIENMSWQLDLKILLNTLYVMVRGKGHT